MVQLVDTSLLLRLAKKESVRSHQSEKWYRQLWEERQRLVPLLEKVIAELSGNERYYFWGSHQILDNLPQILEEI